MSDNLIPFICDGVSLGIPNKDATDIKKLDNVIFLDENGHLHFRDEYIKSLTDVLGKDIETITLEDLTSRMKGVYIKGGQLYFYDKSISRAYSLNEIIGAYIGWKNRLTNGGVYWIGRTKITSSECDNIMINIKGDPTLSVNTEDGRYFIKDENGEYSSNAKGTKVFSIDQYILEGINDNLFDDKTFKRTASDEWRWHDIPNLKIIIPPADLDVSSHILAKTSVRLTKATDPIVFRLFDKTSEEELDRISVANDVNDFVEQQVILTHVGALTPQSSELNKIDCQCPTLDQKEIIEEEPAHTIQVQFYVNEILENDVTSTTSSAVVSGGNCMLQETNIVKYVSAERRLIGIPNSFSSDSIVNSSIDVILYNTAQDDEVGRKSGSISFNNSDLAKIEFDNNFSDANYSISLSCNKNINIWYTNKKPSSFIIKAEKKFTGIVDWSALKLKFEGNA